MPIDTAQSRKQSQQPFKANSKDSRNAEMFGPTDNPRRQHSSTTAANLLTTLTIASAIGSSQGLSQSPEGTTALSTGPSTGSRDLSVFPAPITSQQRGVALPIIPKTGTVFSKQDRKIRSTSSAGNTRPTAPIEDIPFSDGILHDIENQINNLHNRKSLTDNEQRLLKDLINPRQAASFNSAGCEAFPPMYTSDEICVKWHDTTMYSRYLLLNTHTEAKSMARLLQCYYQLNVLLPYKAEDLYTLYTSLIKPPVLNDHRDHIIDKNNMRNKLREGISQMRDELKKEGTLKQIAQGLNSEVNIVDKLLDNAKNADKTPAGAIRNKIITVQYNAEHDHHTDNDRSYIIKRKEYAKLVFKKSEVTHNGKKFDITYINHKDINGFQNDMTTIDSMLHIMHHMAEDSHNEEQKSLVKKSSTEFQGIFSSIEGQDKTISEVMDLYKGFAKKLTSNFVDMASCKSIDSVISNNILDRCHNEDDRSKLLHEIHNSIDTIPNECMMLNDRDHLREFFNNNIPNIRPTRNNNASPAETINAGKLDQKLSHIKKAMEQYCDGSKSTASSDNGSKTQNNNSIHAATFILAALSMVVSIGACANTCRRQRTDNSRLNDIELGPADSHISIHQGTDSSSTQALITPNAEHTATASL